VELIFLDVHMQEGLDGIETAKRIREFNEKVEIIFMTALIEYARYGYEVNARRYLMKCLSYDEFKANLNPCIDLLLNKKDVYVILNTKQETNRIFVDDILYIETDNRDILIHTVKTDYRYNMSMKQIEKILNQERFYRCHTSYIVNLTKIDMIENNMITIGKQSIPVSKYRIKELKVKLAGLLGMAF
jgi:DNA-binding LytR/AlgR family response regulator